jgi:hypothetical protein
MSNLKDLKARIIWAYILTANSETIFVGICSYSGKPCFTGALGLLYLKDFDVAEKSCSRAMCCLNSLCPLNKTTVESFAETCTKTLAEKKQFLQNWNNDRWQEVLKIIASYEPIAKICMEECKNSHKNIVLIDLNQALSDCVAVSSELHE